MLYGATDTTASTRRFAELIDLLWQTDELRLDRPDPTDEARNAVYYLRDLYADAAPQVLDDLAETLRQLGVETAPTARPLTFGTWIGGDRDGNPFVTPAVTRDVLMIQHEHGIQATEAAMDALIDELSVSRRLRGVSLDLSASLAKDLDSAARGGAAVPPHQRRGAVPAQGPLRSRPSWPTPARGCASGTAHVPGRDYLGSDELIADLELMRASLARNSGQLTAVGAVAIGDPHGLRVRPAAGHPRRPRARREAPRGAGPDVHPGRRGRRLRRAGPRPSAPSCSPPS